MARLTIAQVEAALLAELGIFSEAAKALGVSRQAVRQRVKKSPRLQRLLEEIDKETREVALSGMGALIRDKDGTMIRWYLERKAKDLGFGSRVEVKFNRDGAGGAFQLLPAESGLRLQGRKPGAGEAGC